MTLGGNKILVSGRIGGRRSARAAGFVLTLAALLLSTLGPIARPVMAALGDVGYEDGSYNGSAPTGREPQSKLWFNDGIWWASMITSAGNNDIHRLNWATQTWSDTGVQIDNRSKSSADTLWDGTKLYVLSSLSDQSLSCTPSTSGDLSIRMLRYSYDSSSKTYTLDPGFPVTLANVGVQAAALAKDSTGVIWATWGYPSASHGNVYVTHSTTDAATYIAPYVLPLSGVTTMECADYANIVAYDGKIGVMWSNQTESALYFGIHVDGAADSAWTRSTSLSGTGWADNHVNVKSLVADPSGKVFAATKTSLNGDQCPPSAANAGNPLILLVFMDGTGAWQRRTFSTAAECESRPLVQINPDDRKLYMFATQPAPGSSYGSGGSIMYKVTSLDNPNFESGPGDPFIRLAADPKINNVTGTKQTVNGASGLVVLAADDHNKRYVHNAISLVLDTIPPTVTATSPSAGSTGVGTSSEVTATFSEAVTASTVNGSTFTLTDTTTSTNVAGTVSYDASTRTAKLTPTAPLAETHSFSARVVGGSNGVTDLSGNALAADVTWTFSTTAYGSLFSDGFESGNFGAWTLVKVGGDGTATVQTTVVSSGTYAARVNETTGSQSLAYVRKTLASDRTELFVSADLQIAAQGTSGSIPLLRLFDAGGTRRFSLDRAGGSGTLSFADGAGTVTLGGSLPLSTWGHVDLHLLSGTGSALIEVRLNGALIYSNRTRTLTAMRTLQIGNDTKRQLSNTYVDNVNINGAVSGPVAPETTITSGPSGTVNSTSASFGFTSSAGGSTFSCSLDGGAAVGCTSPTPYSGLSEGSHTFTVAATANGQTDPTPASRTWTIDITPPSITATVPADQAVDVAVGTTVQATFSEAMAAASITGSSFTLKDTTAGNTSVAASVAYNAATHVATLTPSAPLAAGDTFTATVQGGSGGVTDAVGNAMASDVTWSFTTRPPIVDNTPPTVSVTAPPNGSTVTGTSVTISANASDDVAVDHVDFLVNGTVVGTDTTNPYSTTWNSTTVPDGPVTITAHAVDTSTNAADSSGVGVTVDNSGGGGPLFADDFESGSLGSWTLVKTGGDGTATVQTSVVKTGTYAARLTASATSGSLAYARKTLSADQSQLTVSGDFQITAEGTSAQNVPLFRIFDAAGTRRVGLFRQSQSGNKIYVSYGGSNFLTTGLLPLGTWGHFDLKVIAGTGTATVEVRLNGALIYSTTTATVPALRTIQIGNDTAAQPMGTYVDNVTVTTP